MKNQLMTWGMVLALVAVVAGCGTIKKLIPFAGTPQARTENADGSVTTKYQDESKIEREKQHGANMGMLYGACALMSVIGGVALLFMKNKDPLILMASGMGGAGVLAWFESAKDVMAWVLPALVAISFIPFYIRWRSWLKKKKAPTQEA